MAAARVPPFPEFHPSTPGRIEKAGDLPKSDFILGDTIVAATSSETDGQNSAWISEVIHGSHTRPIVAR